MKITTAKFMRGIAGTDELLDDGTPQVAIIGRSNVGKSSVINSLVAEKDLARTSAFPGLTQQINIYLLNKSVYLLDLPGYGYAQGSWEVKDRLQKLIYWYFFDSPYVQKKVILIVDANVGFTKNDREMLLGLQQNGKHVFIVANKIDKLKPAALEKNLSTIRDSAPGIPVLPYSAKEKIGVQALADEILS